MAARGGGACDVVLVVAALAWFGLQRLVGPAVNQGETADVPDPRTVYDPVSAGEPLPDGYRDVTSRDVIAPIYEPPFRTTAETDWPQDTLVLGVSLGGESKAYPIRVWDERESQEVE